MKARLAIISILSAAIPAAYAQATFNVVSATYSLDSSGPFNFSSFANSPANTIDFLPGSPAFKVGDSTTYGSGVGTIIYNVTSSTPISGIDLVLQGSVEQFGEINFTETAETSGGGILGSVSGSVKGSSYAGGADGAFTRTVHLSFNQAVTSFKVKKTFDADIGANFPPSLSVATVSLVEQNLTPVPEPASMAGIALGLGALVARKRRRK